jgi:hypothetical protein
MIEHRRVASNVTSRLGAGRTCAVLSVVVLLVLTACSSGSKPAGTSNRRSASTKPVSAGQRILAGIRPDGTVPLLVAEQAFSLAVTPLPGVTIPPGPQDDTLFSATAPVRWLQAHRSELTPAQHRVADPWLDRQAGRPTAAPARMPLGATATAETVAFVVGARPARLPTVATDQQRYEAAVAQVLPVLATHFGPLGYDVPVVIDPNTKGTAFALASGGHTSCTLSVFPKGHFASGSDLKFLVAHELTHCFQDRDTVNSQVNSSSAAWVVEGGADWAGLEVSGPTNLMIGHWDEYLLHPETPLFSRSYDGVGFFAHLKESGTDPWPVLIPMINATDNPGRYANAVGGNASTFEDSWASGMFRGQPMSAKVWNTTGVGMPNSRATPQQTSVGHDVEAPSWTLTTAEVTTKDDVTSIRAGGSVRVGSGANLDQAVPAGTTLDLCTKEGGCTCPAGSKGSAPTAVATSPISIAVTGNATASSAHIAGSTLDEYCKRPPPVAAPASGTGPCRFLSAAEINHITGLHVGPGVEHGDICVFVDPTQPAASPNLNMAAAVVPKVLGDLPAGPARAALAVIASSDAPGGGSGDGGPPGCTSFDPGVGRTALAFSCPANGLGFAGATGRSVGSLAVMYFPSVPGVAGLNTAITSLISTAVSHD